jgi:hypothetical protein
MPLEAGWFIANLRRLSPNLAAPVGIYQLHTAARIPGGARLTQMNQTHAEVGMRRSLGPTASPIAVMAVVAVFLATACTAGQGAATATTGSTRALTTPAPSVAASSTEASTSPSASTALLTWSRASLDEDWPAPVRAEPAGRPTVVPILWRKDGDTGRYNDPTGDTQSDAFPWVDIHTVSFCHNHECPIVWVPGAPNVDPTEQWIAYGLVTDDDGDGVADRRFGIDNIPGPAADSGRHRAWITDLHSGQTESSILNSQETPMVGDTYFRATFPAARPEEPEQPRRLCEGGSNKPTWMRGLAEALVGLGGGDIAGGGSLGGPLPARFYAWASVIVDGRVLATDYAPDAGWLRPSSKAPPIAGEVPAPGPDEVVPPIDSLDEAIAAVVLIDSRLSGFQPGDTHIPGASSWLEAEARGDGWDLTFVCGPETSLAQDTFGPCPAAGCKRAYAKFHVDRDGTVGPGCEWPQGKEAAGCQ